VGLERIAEQNIRDAIALGETADAATGARVRVRLRDRRLQLAILLDRTRLRRR
jgi:hypothetical protein